MLRIILALLIFHQSTSFITYESKVQQIVFGFPDSNCSNSDLVIPFSDSFENIPKVIICPYLYDMNNEQPNEIIFDIVNRSKTSFIINTKCPQTYKAYYLYFRWAAVDDQRIEVINNFNVNAANLGNYTFPTFAHSNVNALYGFVSTIGVGFTKKIAYQLKVPAYQIQIDSITSKEVVVSLQSSTGLISFGFQIILGTVEALSISNPFIFNSMSATQKFSSGSLSVGTGRKLWLPLQGLSYPQTTKFRLQQTYTDTQLAHMILVPVSQYLYLGAESTFDYFIHSQIWYNSTNFVRQPLLFQKMRVSKNFGMPLYSYFIQLQLIELQKSYVSPVNEVLFINNTTQTINLIATLQCYVGYQISGFVLKCISCNNDKIIIQNYCYRGINQISHFIKLNQVNSDYQEIKVLITSDSIKITQTVMNQKATTYTVLSLVFSQ